MKGRRGLAFWHNTALISFAMIAIGITWTVMNSGFSSSELIKDVIEDAVVHSSNGLQVVGKMTGAAKVMDNEVTVTATPVTSTSNGNVNMSIDNIKVSYKIIKDGNYTITYDDIYVGFLNDKTYNSLSEAMVAAKENGLIQVNPLTDSEKPDTTVAFMYWIINQDSDGHVQNNEIASLVVVYAEKDRPSGGEYLSIQVIEKLGILLQLDRTVPNISSSILDMGGKIKGLS
jgi:flagellin FlaB